MLSLGIGVGLTKGSIAGGDASGLGPGIPPPGIDLSFSNFMQSLDMSVTRATTATVEDHLGQVNAVKSGELRFKGLRRVENLLRYSQNFSNTWVKPNIIVTPNSILAPDGTMTGSTLTVGPVASAICIQSTVSKSTLSMNFCYLKKGSGATQANGIAIYNIATSTTLHVARINLDTGAIDTSIGSGTVAVSDAGNGWWKISICCTSGISVGDNVSSYVGFYGFPVVVGEFVYAWGAQRSNTDVVPEYVSTDVLSAPAYHGAYVDGVRYFTTDEAGSPIPEATREGILVEEARTNLAQNSADFTQTSWQKFGSGIAAPAVTQVAGTAPDGSSLVSEVVFPAATGAERSLIFVGSYPPTIQPNTGSVWMRATAGTPTVYISVQAGSGAATNKACLLSTSWQRFEVTHNVAVIDSHSFMIGPDGSVGQPMPQAGSTVQVWGGQFEVGAFATSYIPTTTAAVTRNADVITLTYPGAFSTTQGTWIISYKRGDSTAATAFAGNDGAGNNGGDIVGADFLGADYVRAYHNAGSTRGLFKYSSFTYGQDLKAGIAYVDTVSLVSSVNGVAGSSLGDPGASSYGTTANIGSAANGGSQLNNTIRSIKWYNTALTQTQLNAVTA